MEPERPRDESTDSAEDDEIAAGRPTPDAEPGTPDDRPRELSRDLVFDALKNSRRRHVLRFLKDRDEGVALGELAEHVAAIENDTTPAALDSQQRKRVYVGLYQCHLPRLDDMDLVDYDRARGTVELGPCAPQVDRYLYVGDADDRLWRRSSAEFVGASAVVLAGGVAAGVLEGASAVVLLGGICVGVAALVAVRGYGWTR